jgi:hypothetical protein
MSLGFVLYIASLALVIWAIVDLARRPSAAFPSRQKVFWIVGLVVGWFLFPIIGAVIAVAYLAGYRRRLNAGRY